MRLQLLAATTLGCFCIGMALAADNASTPKPEATKGQIPAGATGFAGMVTGKVISKGDDQVLVNVVRIDRTWKHSRAENAESLVGKDVTIKIVAHVYEKKEGYLARVRNFFHLLRVGDSDSFDVKHADGDSLTFLELTKEQMDRVEKAGK